MLLLKVTRKEQQSLLSDHGVGCASSVLNQFTLELPAHAFSHIVLLSQILIFDTCNSKLSAIQNLNSSFLNYFIYSMGIFKLNIILISSMCETALASLWLGKAHPGKILAWIIWEKRIDLSGYLRIGYMDRILPFQSGIS